MAAFNLPKEVDEFFYIEFLIILLMSILHNSFMNGQVTLFYYDDIYNKNPDFMAFSQEDQSLKDYLQKTEYSNKNLRYIIPGLYFLSLLISIYYSIFIFKRHKYLNIS